MIRKLLTLTLLLTFCILANPNQATAASKATVKDCIVKHSLELGVDPAIGLSIAKIESGFVHEKRSAYHSKIFKS